MPLLWKKRKNSGVEEVAGETNQGHMDDNEALYKYFMYTRMKKEGYSMTIEDVAAMETCEHCVLTRGLLDKEAVFETATKEHVGMIQKRQEGELE